jgi:hypothetical protein
VIFSAAWLSARSRGASTNAKRDWVFVAGHLIAPLAVCAVVCASYQVIYYRPRYSVIVLPYFLVCLAWACTMLGRRQLQTAAVIVAAGAMALGTGLQTTSSQKRAWRETAAAWPTDHAPSFYVILPSFQQRALSHYLGGRVRHTPRHVLERLSPLPEGTLIWVANWPDDLSAEDAEYRDWLKGVGGARHLLLPSYYSITQVEPSGVVEMPEFARQRFRSWYRPFDVRGKIDGFSDATRFDELAFDPQGTPYRDTAIEGWFRLDDVEPGEQIVIDASFEPGAVPPRVAALRGPEPEGFSEFEKPGWAEFEIVDGELRVLAPSGTGPVWIGWGPAPDSVAAAGPSIRWVGVGSSVKSERLVTGR